MSRISLLLPVLLAVLVSACSGSLAAQELNRVSDVLALDGREAKASPREVRLKGVVLGVSTQFNFFSLHDGTGTIGIMRTRQQVLKQGDQVEVTGLTTTTLLSGRLYPRVMAESVQVTGTGKLPPPVSISLKSFVDPASYDQWIQVEGHVMEWKYRAPDLVVRLAGTDNFVEANITLPAEAGDLPRALMGARVRLSALVVSTPESGRLLFVPGPGQLEVLDAGTRDVFDAPLVSAREVIQRKVESGRRWRVRGTYIARTEPRKIVVRSPEGAAMLCYLLQPRGPDEPGTLYSDAGQWPSLNPGDTVEVVGSIIDPFITNTLSWCQVRVVGLGQVPKPEPMDLETLKQLRRDDRWVRVEVVVGSWSLQNNVMLFRVNDAHSTATLSVPWPSTKGFPKNWFGARLRFTGITSSLAPGSAAASLVVPDDSFVEVVRPGKADPFDCPELEVEEIADRQAPAGEPVKTRGHLIALSGKSVYVRGPNGAVRGCITSPWEHPTESGGMSFADGGPVPHLTPGDEVELVGRPVLSTTDNTLVPFDLHGVILRVVGPPQPVSPAPAKLAAIARGGQTSNLVETRGRLLTMKQSPLEEGGWRTTLLLAEGSSRLPVVHDGPDIASFETLKVDDDVLVRGLVDRASLLEPRQIRLLLPTDTRSLGVSPAVLTQRFWLWGGGGGTVLLFLLIWIAVLRRAGQVQKQAAARLKAAIKAAQASERRWKLLFEQNPLSVQIFDPDGQTKLFNEAWRKLFKLDDAAGHAFNVLKTPRLAAGVVEQIRKAFAGEVVQVPPVPFPMRDNPRDVRWISGVLYPLKNEEGEIMEVVTIHNDITEIKKAEEAMLAMNQTLEQRVNERTRELKLAQTDLIRALEQERELNELKSRFVTMVSHEFRTPLGIIMSAIELIRHYEDRLPPEQRRELCDDIFGATRLMASLMEQVLVLGRVEAGKLGCRVQPLDIETLVGKLTDESLSATNRKCPVEWRALNSLADAEADEALLRHIFSNLITNAVKYSPADSPVQFTARREGRNAVFQVIDQGIGIPAEDRARLFEAFYRCGNVGEIPGTGLGLLIVKRCVDLHGGSLWVESELGQGSTFTVSIPMFGEDDATS